MQHFRVSCALMSQLYICTKMRGEKKETTIKNQKVQTSVRGTHVVIYLTADIFTFGTRAAGGEHGQVVQWSNLHKFLKDETFLFFLSEQTFRH